MPVTVTWLGHASFKIASAITAYIDPWKLDSAPHDADLVLVSHSHFDHYSADDIAKVAGKAGEIVAPADVIDQHGQGRAIQPGQTLTVKGVTITAVPAYNPAKEFHPRQNNWVGFIVEMDGKRIYYAGDTDLIPEMQDLGNIDLALLPVGGTYTMDPQEAAQALQAIQPRQVLPYHWGDIVGSQADAEKLQELASCEVVLLQPGRSTTL